MHWRSTDRKCLRCGSETAIVAQNPEHTNSWWNRSALVSKKGGLALFYYRVAGIPLKLHHQILYSILELQKHILRVSLNTLKHNNRRAFKPSILYTILIQTNLNWVKHLSVLGWSCSWTTWPVSINMRNLLRLKLLDTRALEFIQFHQKARGPPDSLPVPVAHCFREVSDYAESSEQKKKCFTDCTRQ